MEREIAQFPHLLNNSAHLFLLSLIIDFVTVVFNRLFLYYNSARVYTVTCFSSISQPTLLLVLLVRCLLAAFHISFLSVSPRWVFQLSSPMPLDYFDVASWYVGGLS